MWTRRVVRRMDYRIWAAGDAAGEADLYIPVYRGVPITAEASLTREFVEDSPSLRNQLGERMHSPDFEIVHRRITVQRVDDLSLVPAFVKIDTQGHEQAVLTGMTDTLKTHGPPVLVEAPSSETTSFMVALGYQPYSYDDAGDRLIPLNGHPVTNVMFARSLPRAA